MSASTEHLKAAACKLQEATAKLKETVRDLEGLKQAERQWRDQDRKRWEEWKMRLREKRKSSGS